MLSNYIRFFLENKLVAWLLVLFFIGWGLVTAPFDFEIPGLPRDPVAVDAIPDIGENQQIVFTEWMGRSPQDVEDQITYPLTTSLLGIPGVKSIRSNSMFGFSSIYIIFEDNILPDEFLSLISKQSNLATTSDSYDVYEGCRHR